MKKSEYEPPMKKVELFALPGIPPVEQGDNIAKLFSETCGKNNFSIQDNDILVVAQKIVSKAEGRIVSLLEVIPTQEAIELAKKTGRDPQLCQVIIEESRRILYTDGRTIISEHKLGFVNTSSCVDRSNSGSQEGNLAILLPIDPDESARRIRKDIFTEINKNVAVIINDSFGRPWRKGSVGMAIGLAGVKAVHTQNSKDLFNRGLKTEVALVDEIAASASMLMGQTNEGLPIVIIRGVNYQIEEKPAIQELLRPAEEDQIWEKEM